MSIALYEKCLIFHDWFSDFSCDHSVYRKGRAEKEQIIRMQKLYDEDCTLWNYYAPEEFKKYLK
jgi:hypothetical protein